MKNDFLEWEKTTQPNLRAVIREAECIGCTKCITACPVDSILGGAKQMHTVIGDECTGCELCIAPCPVDCIDMVAVPIEQQHINKSAQYRQRYDARQTRLQAEKNTEKNSSTVPSFYAQDKKAYIQAALLRTKQKNKS